MSSSFETKLARVRAFMTRHELEGLVLSRLDNLFWLGCGLDAHVPIAAETGVASLVVTVDRVVLVTTNIEAPRLRDEELHRIGVPLEAVPWWEDRLGARVAELCADAARVGSDVPAPGREVVNLAPLRYSLLPDEVAAYRAHGADQGAAIGQVAREFARGESEFQIAGRLAGALLARGITPTVLLVAADERIAHYRHPIPTARCVDRAALLVAGGRRDGLVVSVSRMVCFGQPGSDLRQRHEAVCAVDAAFIAATVPSTSVAEVFASGVAAYAAAGFPDEWQHHHQGGATGYQGRDYRGSLTCNETVAPWQAFAWNPSIAGTKSEDTIIATPDGPEILSASPDWPLLAVRVGSASVARADLLRR
ncbi:MAG: aminopeptidase P family N-terminal domain-containing protein [Armatimonadetes bacterium]|nr:aminopeptidase P family N-terminal domain-containing protein [Armatimonadota bacterium]